MSQFSVNTKVLDQLGITHWRPRANFESFKVSRNNTVVENYVEGEEVERDGELLLENPVAEEQVTADSPADAIEIQIPSSKTASIAENTATYDSQPSADQQVDAVSESVPTPDPVTPEPFVTTQYRAEPSPETELGSATVLDSTIEIDVPEPRSLSQIQAELRCPTCEEFGSVFGGGNPIAELVVVKDSPTSMEAAENQLYIGRQATLFDAMLDAINLDRSSIYVTSVFKCPPGEASADGGSIRPPLCDQILAEQIAAINPAVILTFGEFSAQSLLRSNDKLSILRSNEQRYRPLDIPLIASFTPMQLMQEPLYKARAWEDLQRVAELLALNV